MAAVEFNYKSSRSELARIAIRLNKVVVVCLGFLALATLVGGVLCLMTDSPLGWVMTGLSFIPAMIIEWYKGELVNLPSVKKIQTIDDCLSVDILGRLPNQPTPKDIAKVIGSVAGGQFIGARFGIGPNFMFELASESRDDTSKIWQEAWNIRQVMNSREINPVMLAVALIRSLPNFKTLLNHLQLDDVDLNYGIEWYDHIINLIGISNKPKMTGGIARDWSFGWTPLLNRFGFNISQQSVNSDLLTTKLEAHDDLINQLIEILSSGGRQNVALVGQLGVGKTQIVKSFAARIMNAENATPSNLKFRQIIALDASSILASATNRGQIEQLVPRILSEAYNAKNIIIFLDNAELFFSDGIGAADITNVLLPILEAGKLRIILAMDEQVYLKISNTNPKLANVLNRVSVAPANREQTIAVMQDQSISIEHKNHVMYMYQSLAEAYKLSERYVYDLAMPGRALRLFETAANYSENGIVTAKSVQQAVEKTIGVKVSLASGDDEREKLLKLEEFIHKRMINQSRAVTVVSDALRRARAGVRNQNCPIGAFLFLGPTGVGKTELAKALADVYFGDENNIIRVDMNEYVKASDVSKLIANSSEDMNSLTARIMKRPFSVVLLDEIEKAHPNVMLSLLQMIDEGIMRDEQNREISFRDSIIIATSNAGSEKIREYINIGYDIEKFEGKLIDSLIDSNQFRPEFINRFDEVVVFRPLNKDELIQVVDLMIEGVNKTLAQQKVSVSVPDDAKKYLVEAGYDPKLGARPMRRMVQRAVENLVAKKVLSGEVSSGGSIAIELEQVRSVIGLNEAAKRIVEPK